MYRLKLDAGLPLIMNTRRRCRVGETRGFYVAYSMYAVRAGWVIQRSILNSRSQISGTRNDWRPIAEAANGISRDAVEISEWSKLKRIQIID